MACSHHNVPAAYELQPRFEEQHVQDVEQVTQVVHGQPHVDVTGSLVWERTAHRDQPDIPVPGQGHEEQPQHVHQVLEGGGESSDV